LPFIFYASGPAVYVAHIERDINVAIPTPKIAEPPLRIGYHRYSALFHACNLLEVSDSDGQVFTGRLCRNNVRPAINDVEPWMTGLQAPGSKIYLVM